ncbi:hypothetical protein [Adonisia turfae]|uniref:Uncharacterized protein n=1 Tax=Adonisia turfae CCMR0081 TaxID=2292702 RepID=A0A6M0RTR4_9CYAN|nr:hypothetical protein [Adonisia turfae]NEZ59142.1 hypothetical protein [Adonisia turfae CCMR0081]
MAHASYTITTVSTLAIGLPRVPPVMAHNGVIHGQPQETTPAEPVTAEPESVGSSGSASESHAEDMTVEPITESEEADAPQSLYTTFSLTSLPIGPGEVLLGLILIFPWLLITLRKQLHRATRS